VLLDIDNWTAGNDWTKEDWQSTIWNG